MKYWKCRRKYDCNARLTTVNTGRNLLIRKGEDDSHNHAPNEEVEALHNIGAIKREVNEHPDCGAAAVMRVAVNASSFTREQFKNNYSERTLNRITGEPKFYSRP